MFLLLFFYLYNLLAYACMVAAHHSLLTPAAAPQAITHLHQSLGAQATTPYQYQYDHSLIHTKCTIASKKFTATANRSDSLQTKNLLDVFTQQQIR